MATAAVNGARLYYEEHGKGFPVVLAHGGWGLSHDRQNLGPAAFVDDLRGLLDHLGIQETFLVGQSMGGLTCLGFTLACPERVRGLVMANTFAGVRGGVWLAADEGLRAQARSLWDKRRADGVKRALSREFSRKHPDRAFLYKQIRLLNEDGPNRLQSEAQ